MKLLLTGFEPFGGQTINPSERVVRVLGQQSIAGVELHTAILPVDRKRGPAQLLEHVAGVQPDAVICLGEAGRRVRVSIERVAINLLDYRIPDNTGQQVIDEPIVADGPDAYFVTLPVRALLHAVQEANVPAELSLSAGTFLCNQVTYTVLHHVASTRRRCMAGFIHLPYLPEQVVHEAQPLPSMALETMARGIGAAITALAPSAQ